jgi:acetylornithine deacetylase/succinyl-diaminopimelate desuccinylase-like protein
VATTDVDSFLTQRWYDELVPVLSDYIRIPAKSPAFDRQWEENGHIAHAVDLLSGWARARAIAGMSVEVVRLPGRTPVIVCDVPASGTDATGTVLLYGHLDKQPEFTGWRDGLGAWEPVLEGTRLYGRGSADDGYAIFAALSAIEAVQAGGRAHAHCVVLIEATEESGSYDLPAYLEHLRDRLGTVELVVTLDSAGASWDRLWITTSLRGLLNVDVRVDVLDVGVHSGGASGAVPSSFRVLRALLDRVEDAATGRVLIDDCHVEIPADRVEEAVRAGEAAGAPRFPLAASTQHVQDDPVERLLAVTWRPALSYTGADGFPPIADGGNVLRPFTALRLSLRLPPTVDSHAALDAIRHALETDPPYGAPVTISGTEASDGWAAPVMEPWLRAAADDGSLRWFGEPSASWGIGGSIPFMAMLGNDFPNAQYLITGVIGPGCNVHGPNEFLDIEIARKLTGAVSDVLAAHADR